MVKQVGQNINNQGTWIKDVQEFLYFLQLFNKFEIVSLKSFKKNLKKAYKKTFVKFL